MLQFHLCAFVTSFQEMFVFQVPGKNVKWKALLMLQNKFNFILFQHLQLFLSSKCTNRVPDSNMNIFTRSPSSSHRHLPEAADQWEWRTSIKDRLLTTRSLKIKQKPANKSAKTLTTCKQGGASLWCIHYSIFWYARWSMLSPFQSRCSKMLQLHKLIIERWKALPHCWMIQWGTEHLQAICVSPM